MVDRMTLSDLDFRNNAIGFLRLVFAAVVVWSHAYGIGGFGGDPIYMAAGGSVSAGFLAVGGFFVLSGFLITRSFETAPSVGRFLWHRCLRILPAFWACLVVVAFVFAPLVYWHENGTLTGFLSGADSPWSYVTNNALLGIKQIDVRGLLHHLPSPPAFNGSLWTLQWEFLCYIAVAMLGVAAVSVRKAGIVIAAAIVAYVLAAVLSWHTYPGTSFAGDVMTLLAYFATGSSAYVIRAKIPMLWPLAIAAGVAAVMLLSTKAAPFVVLPCLAYLVLFAAMKLPVRSFDRNVDLSYGVYIYAYPVQQLLVVYGVAAFGLTIYFGIGIAAASAIAAGSWFAIERPALSFKNVRFRPERSRRSGSQGRPVNA